ncbi:MAG: Crp/Fnr family transcriptional regulator [Kaistella sp.]|nr:Crp/Fnr family transcriptional regulator [Kaistella sp.]
MSESLKHIYAHFLLTEEHVSEIMAAHERIEVCKGHFLLEEGKTANEYFVLESGLVRAFVNDYNGNEITTEFFTVNDIVIQPASLFQRTASQENIQSVNDAVLWKIDFDIFQELFYKFEGFPEWGRLWFSYQLFFVKQRSIEMITQSASERYLKLLKEKPQIIQQAPLKYIASYLGITDTSLSRIRKEILDK